MISQPLVSIIVAVPDFINWDDSSIYNQTYANIELIFVGQNLDRIKKPDFSCKIKLVECHFSTIPDAFNKGISHASGEWISFYEFKHSFDPDRIKILIDQLSPTTRKVAFTMATGLDHDQKTLAPDHPWKQKYDHYINQILVGVFPTIGFQVINSHIHLSSSNLFIHRSLFEQIGSFKTNIKAYCLDFLLRALPLTEPALIRTKLFNFHVDQAVNFPLDEVQKIHLEYYTLVRQTKPANTIAPCYWYWPTEFDRLRTAAKFNESLNVLIENRGNLPQKDLASIEHLLGQTNGKKLKKSITLISHELSRTGAPRLIVDIAICLSRLGYKINMISMRGGPLEEDLKKENIPCYITGNITEWKSLFNLSYAILFKAKSNLIINSLCSFMFALPLAFIRFRTKPIWYIHESVIPSGLFSGRRAKFLNYICNLSAKYAPPTLWFGSQETKKAWSSSHFPEGKVFYWSGIPRLNEHPTSKPIRNILTAGSSSIRKGTHILIDAFLLLLKEKRIADDTMLTIVGMPQAADSSFTPMADSMWKILVSEFRDNFRIIENVTPEQLEALYDDAHLYVQSSIMECLPLAVLKAMAKGLPIITTDADGCKEVIAHKKTGYICPTHCVESLAAQIEFAVKNPELSCELGKNGQSHFNEHLSFEATWNVLHKELTQQF